MGSDHCKLGGEQFVNNFLPNTGQVELSLSIGIMIVAPRDFALPDPALKAASGFGWRYESDAIAPGSSYWAYASNTRSRTCSCALASVIGRSAKPRPPTVPAMFGAGE